MGQKISYRNDETGITHTFIAKETICLTPKECVNLARWNKFGSYEMPVFLDEEQPCLSMAKELARSGISELKQNDIVVIFGLD